MEAKVNFDSGLLGHREWRGDMGGEAGLGKGKLSGNGI
jgi:hypothetical protein